MFGNAPLLKDHSQYEIRLGASAATLHGELLFVTDTEGRYPRQYLYEHTKKITPDELGRIFGKKTIPKEVSLTNPWPTGPTIRRSLLYADNLSDTPAQLTDGVLVCGGARATVLPERFRALSRRQYVGFQRGRVSEQLRSTERSAFSLHEFSKWTGELSQYIVHNDESFAVALKEPDVFYTSQAFYQIDYTHAESRLGDMLSARPNLDQVTSEKGRKGKQKTRWDDQSIFHSIDVRANWGLIHSEFPDSEFIFCDDMGTEVADFVCADFAQHRIAFIHAKYGENHKVSASALHDAVSQAIKNLSVLSRTGARPKHIIVGIEMQNGRAQTSGAGEKALLLCRNEKHFGTRSGMRLSTILQGNANFGLSSAKRSKNRLSCSS